MRFALYWNERKYLFEHQKQRSFFYCWQLFVFNHILIAFDLTCSANQKFRDLNKTKKNAKTTERTNYKKNEKYHEKVKRNHFPVIITFNILATFIHLNKNKKISK